MLKELDDIIRAYTGDVITIPTRTYNANEVIIKKGDESTSMFEIIEGRVGIYSNYGKKGQKLLAKKYDGEYFGEIALIEKRPRTATVVALTDDTILREYSSIKGFISYIFSHPQVLEPILNAMSDRYKERINNYIDTCELVEKYKKAVDAGEVSEALNKKIEKLIESKDDFQRI